MYPVALVVRMGYPQTVTSNDWGMSMARARLYESDAARVAAYRARQDLVQFNVDLPADLVRELEEYMRFKNVTKRQVIEKLLRSQLLRKR